MADLSTPSWIRWWFRGAAIYGILALLLSLRTPPPGDPLFFRAFFGTALAFQIVFWIIGGAPARYRPLMLAGVVEKLGFVLPAAGVIAAGAAPGTILLAGAIDLTLGVGFLVAWLRTPRA